MTQQHPITPPPELRRLWAQQAQRINPHDPVEWMQCVSEKAAQWGADQELEACIEWMTLMGYWGEDGKAIPALRADRRPKPPSLKYQALKSLGHINRGIDRPEDTDIIRRALEQLDD
jgi:hypothetical protein